MITNKDDLLGQNTSTIECGDDGEGGEGEGGCVYVDGKESWREMAARLAKGGIPN